MAESAFFIQDGFVLINGHGSIGEGGNRGHDIMAERAALRVFDLE